LSNDPRAEHQRLDFLSVEHQRRQVVTRLEAIATPASPSIGVPAAIRSRMSR
jgi:hypothetical protein